MRRQLIPAACVLVAMLVGWLVWQFVFHTHYHMEGVIVDELGAPLDGVSVHIQQSRFNASKWPNGADYTYHDTEADRSFSVDVNLGLLEGINVSFYKKDYDSVRYIIPERSRMVGMRIVMRRQLQWDPAGSDNTTGPVDKRIWPKIIPRDARVVATSTQPQPTTAPVDGTYVLVSKTGEIFCVRRFYRGSEIGFLIEAGNLCSVPSTMGSDLVENGAPYEWRLYSTATRLPPTPAKPRP